VILIQDSHRRKITNFEMLGDVKIKGRFDFDEGRGIRVKAISPGVIPTPAHENASASRDALNSFETLSAPAHAQRAAFGVCNAAPSLAFFIVDISKTLIRGRAFQRAPFLSGLPKHDFLDFFCQFETLSVIPLAA
jgi:hypothetical protein